MSSQVILQSFSMISFSIISTIFGSRFLYLSSSGSASSGFGSPSFFSYP
jgi:hypothetical protein